MVIRELIEASFNTSYQAFYKWANYNTYAKLTETNIQKMKLILDLMQLTKRQTRLKLLKLMTLDEKIKVTTTIFKSVKKIRQK